MPTRTVSPGTARRLTGDEDFDGLTRAVETLPAAWYIDAGWYRRELDRIFFASWVYVCHQDQFAASRSFRRVSIGDQDILLVRGEDGEIRGFHNTCRHRGSALCLEDGGRLPGRVIRCPYHQWTYALDGTLIATTSLAEPADFDKSDYPLLKVAVRVWRGLVFVSLAPQPAGLEAGFERGSDRIDNWPMAELAVGHTWRKTMACNWKVFWENFNECLHCPNIHPELCDLVPIYGRRISYFRDDPRWPDHAGSDNPAYSGGLKPGAASWSSSGRALDERFDGLTDEENQRGQSYFVSLPSVFIAAHVDYMRTVRILPTAVEETEIVVEWLFQKDTLARADFDMEDIVGFTRLVMEQDARASELNQRGLHASSYRCGVLMPEEHHVKRFHDWVRARLSD